MGRQSGSQILVRVSKSDLEAAKLAARVLGYPTLTAMLREAVRDRIAWARDKAPYFDAALADRMKEQSDE